MTRGNLCRQALLAFAPTADEAYVCGVHAAEKKVMEYKKRV